LPVKDKLLYLNQAQVEACGVDILEIIDTIEASFKKKAEGRTELPLKPTIHPRPGCFSRTQTPTVTAAPMLTKRRAVIKGEWITPGAICLPLDFDSYFATSAFAVCSKFYGDDKDQLYWFKENGKFV